jgi:hypothetical protein
MAEQPLPSQSISPIAESVAKRLRTFATIYFVLGGLFCLSGLSMLSRPSPVSPSEAVLGAAFWVLVMGWIGVRARRKAAGVLAAGQTAAVDPSIAWYLRDLMLVAVDGNGAPRPDLSFKIRPQHRTMLSVLPTARALP